MKKAFTLYELNSMVRETIETTLNGEYWVEAELSECRENGGICYMELVQKDETSNTPIAKASAKCWRNRWTALRPYFERTTGQRLHAGMKVMLQVYPQFHERYGFSWIVTDINPEYTLGDLARRRQEIVRQLKDEGVFDLQRELQLPVFAQRIAVISSSTAAGYGDFCDQLEDNDYGFKFYTKLFPAIMQGEQVESSIIKALNRINDRVNDFDVVVIIRGGGGTSDFSGFDTLPLAENVANFPLPIITGIGHERDECVLDMVSNTRVKTPTAAASFLIDHLAEVYSFLVDAQNRIVNHVQRKCDYEKVRLEKISKQIPLLFSVVKTRQDARLEMIFRSICSASKALFNEKKALLLSKESLIHKLIRPYLEQRHNQLKQIELQISSLDPKRILKYGYSITYSNGRAVHDASALKSGEEIMTIVEKGKIKSVVKR